MLDMFALWPQKFTNELPSVVMSIFKTGIQLKSTNQIILQSYLECLLLSIQCTEINNHSATIKPIYKQLHSLNGYQGEQKRARKIARDH